MTKLGFKPRQTESKGQITLLYHLPPSSLREAQRAMPVAPNSGASILLEAHVIFRFQKPQ